MSVEQPKGVGDFNATWPRPTDSPTEGDDHIRLIKVQLNKIFAKFDKPLTMTSDQLNGVISKLKANGVNLEVLSGLLTVTPAASEAGKKAVNAEWVRQYATGLMTGAVSHKDIADAIAAALLNYYTKAEMDAKWAELQALYGGMLARMQAVEARAVSRGNALFYRIGHGAPDPALGENGDMAFEDNHNLGYNAFWSKQGGAWHKVGTLVNP